jgi:hypothetical protein
MREKITLLFLFISIFISYGGNGYGQVIDITACPNESVALCSPIEGVNYDWSESSNGDVRCIDYYHNKTSEVILTVTNIDGTLDRYIFNVIIDNIAAKFYWNDVIIDYGESVNLNLLYEKHGYSNTIVNGYSVKNVHIENALITPSQDTIFTVKAIDINGCPVAHSTLIAVRNNYQIKYKDGYVVLITGKGEHLWFDGITSRMRTFRKNGTYSVQYTFKGEKYYYNFEVDKLDD